MMRMDENSIIGGFASFVLGAITIKRLSTYDSDICYLYLIAGMLMLYGLITEKKNIQDGSLCMLSFLAGVQITDRFIAYNASLKIGSGHS